MHRKFLVVPVLAVITGLSACNDLRGGSDLERAAVGGAVGCAAGELISSGNCIAGAGVGAAAGALTN